MNESGAKIAKNFYLIGWDQQYWQIVYSLDDKVHNPEKVIIRHDVFAVGHNKDFIIAKQHPCEDIKPHLLDLDSLKPNKDVTKYYIIDIRNEDDTYSLHMFHDYEMYMELRKSLGVPEDLTYKFYDKELE